MKIWTFTLSIQLMFAVVTSVPATAQAGRASPSPSLETLVAMARHGTFPDAAHDADGRLFVLVDDGRSTRILRIEPDGATISAQSQIRGPGEGAIAFAIGPGGDVYVIGTTHGSGLGESSRAILPSDRNDSTQSFLAKYDANLNLASLTYLSAGSTEANGVAVTADAVFVTGTTWGDTLPVTPGVVQRTPMSGARRNGFVERFTADDLKLVYATYLTGIDGDTAPAAIVADDADEVYVAGSTTARDFPITAALQPSLGLPAGEERSGFVSELTPAGDAFAFSTYVTGSGITGLALDRATDSLVLTGTITWGKEGAGMAEPSIEQTLLRLSDDGRSVRSPTALVPGLRSLVSAGPDGGLWVYVRLASSVLTDGRLRDYGAGLDFLTYVAGIGDGDWEMDGSAKSQTGKGLSDAGARKSSLNPGLGLSSSALTFQTPVVVTQVSATAQILNVSNTGQSAFPLTFSVSGDFTLANGCPASLSPKATCSVQIGFAPSQPGQRSGVLSVTSSNGYSPTYVSLAGTALGLLPANDGTLDLGQTLLGEPAITWYQIQQPIASLTAATNNSSFGVALVADTGSGHGSLPASAFAQTTTANCNNCWLGVQFLSQTAAAQSGSLTLTSDAAGSPYTVVLDGVALPVQGMLLTPVSLDFGAVPVNSSTSAATFTLANLLSNPATVTIQSVTLSGDFVLATNSTGGPSCSGALAPTASCFLQVAFAPTATGTRTGLLTISTSGGTVTTEVTGSGVADPGLAINPLSLDFEDVPNQTATQQTLSLSNTGSAALTIGAVSSSSASFGVGSNCSALPVGARCTLLVTFSPGNASVAGALSIPVTSSSGGHASTTTYRVALSGNYAAQNAGMEIIAGQINFGSDATGSLGGSRALTLNNLTAQEMSVQLTLPDQFPLASASACPTLPANGSCTFSVSYVPVTGGPATGTVVAQGTFSDGSDGGEVLAYMMGYGSAGGSLLVGGNLIPNAPIDFGEVSSGESAHEVITLTNNGSGGMTIRRITAEPPFFSTSNCGATLLPDQNCAVALTYAPINEAASVATEATRTDSGTLVVESDAMTSPNDLQLTGIVTPVVSGNPTTPAVLNALTMSNGSLTFPNTKVGNVSPAQEVAITNVGTTTVHILSASASMDFASSGNCGTLQPGYVCTLSVAFEPTTASTASVRSGTLEVLSDAGVSLDFVTLLGTSAPAALTLSPVALDFGTVDVGASDALSVSVSNTGSTPVTFLGIASTGDYSVNAGLCPADGSTFAVGAVCVLTVTFKPSATGVRAGTLSLTSDATQQPLTVALTGTAVEAQLTVSPGALSFGSIDVDSPGLLTLTLLNTGSASVTGISNTVSGANGGDFSVTAVCSTTTLAPNQGCAETVTFTPRASGARVATLTVASSDPKGPATIALSGTGIAAGSFTLTVNGGSAAMVTVMSGSPATYPLVLTPNHGFTGLVALTCTPLSAGEYTSCSLPLPTLTLGSSAMNSTATISTIAAADGETVVAIAGLFALPLLLRSRRRRLSGKKFARAIVAGGIFAIGFGAISGCGGGGGGGGSKVLTTPPGTYRYVVTANSTSGVAVSSSVTLTLVVQ